MSEPAHRSLGRDDRQDVAVWRSADELTSFMERAHEPCTAVMHRITNQHISTNDDGSPTARSYIDAILLFPGETGLQMTGWYDDRVVRTAGGWKIADRKYTRMLHQQVTPLLPH